MKILGAEKLETSLLEQRKTLRSMVEHRHVERLGMEHAEEADIMDAALYMDAFTTLRGP
jgi:hypothetical protein